MFPLLTSFAFASLILSGAIFGFFYAWICSTMWGLDAIDPRVAIQAMQGMNASVRNVIFAPAFFGTPVVMILTGVLAFLSARRAAGWAFLSGGVVYLLGGVVLTATINVPMNEALAAISVPETQDAAAIIWADYSPRWQIYNQIRTAFSGGALVLAGLGLFCLRAPNPNCS